MVFKLVTPSHYTIVNNSESVNRFLCNHSSESFTFFLKSQSLIEALSKELCEKDENIASRVNSLVEALETSMVNSESRYSVPLGIIKDNQIKIMEGALNKKIKNDFKDDVKLFFSELIRPCYSLKDMDEGKRVDYLKDYIHNLNTFLHKRRLHQDIPTATAATLSQGLIIPFELESGSNMIVRLHPSEARIFETKERCPYYFVLETIDPSELSDKDPEYKKDPAYRKMIAKLIRSNSNPDNDSLLPESKIQVDLKSKTPQKTGKKISFFSSVKRALRRSVSSHVSDRKRGENIEHMSKAEWFDRKSHLFSDFILVKLQKSNGMHKVVKKLWDHYFELVKKKLDKEEKKIKKTKKRQNTGFGPWPVLWEMMEEQFRQESPYENFKSLRIRPIIVKAGDDLRQELFAMGLIRIFEEIFVKENIHVNLKTYKIILNDQESGLIEFIPDSISIDALKKKYPGMSLDNIFTLVYAHKLEEAKKNFTQSLAGYSFLTYILRLRDRHNGNLLIDSEGNIIHIDFGFLLGHSPGGIDFEAAPFKLTEEFGAIMEGRDSKLFIYFKVLIYQCFVVIRKHIDYVCNAIEIMMEGSSMKCFSNFDLKGFRDRFNFSLNDNERETFVDELIYDSYANKRTMIYDSFQKLTNGIEN